LPNESALLQRDKKMNKNEQTACTRCGHDVEVVATVVPNQRGPGVVAWMCPACGTADSILVHRDDSWQTSVRQADY
jgi:uncharacterized Zn finger protein